MASAAGRLALVQTAADPEKAESQAARLADAAFDPRKWDKQLKRTIAPLLLKAMVTGAATELAVKRLVIDIQGGRGGRLKTKGVKATTAEEAVQQYGIDWDSDQFPLTLPQWFIEAAADRLHESMQQPYWNKVTDTVRNDIESLLFRGIRDGHSIKDIAKALVSDPGIAYAQRHATTVARTETGNAMNAGHALGIQHLAEEGLPAGKEWLSIMGPTTRETHAEADGQVVGADENFTVGGYEAPWPSHDSLPAEERCNCQCTMISAFVGQELEPEDEAPPESDSDGEMPNMYDALLEESLDDAIQDVEDMQQQAEAEAAAAAAAAQAQQEAEQAAAAQQAQQELEQQLAAQREAEEQAKREAEAKLEAERLERERLEAEARERERLAEIERQRQLEEAAKLLREQQEQQAREEAARQEALRLAQEQAARARQEARKPPGGIPDLDKLTDTGTQLGGSTGARLYQDEAGNKYVVKRGNSEAQIRDEYAAEAAYRALGAPIPKSQLFETANGPVKVSAFIEGKPLSALPPEDQEKAFAKLQKHFAADAVLGNWDVAGMGLDNVIVANDGTPYRIDTGGALRFRAQGSPKGAAFGSHPMELWTLRDPKVNQDSAKVFGGMKFENVVKSSKAVLDKRDKLLATIKDPALRSTIEARLQQLERFTVKADRMEAADFKGTYTDKFTRHDMALDQRDVWAKTSASLTPDKYDQHILRDATGKEFDELRGENGAFEKFMQYMREQPGGLADLVSEYGSSQGCDSWSTTAAAVKHVLKKHMSIPAKEIYWQKGSSLETVTKEIERRLGPGAMNRVEDMTSAFHAFTVRTLEKVDLPHINREAGTILLTRTEDMSVLSRKYGLKEGDQFADNFKRGLCESHSLMTEISVYGDTVTAVEVPLERVFGTYLHDRRGVLSAKSFFAGDVENEFAVIAAGTKGAVGGASAYGIDANPEKILAEAKRLAEEKKKKKDGK